MASTVTIDNDLRKRIKKLAAELDTTQGEIIREAIELFEMSGLDQEDNLIPGTREMIKNTISKHDRKEWKKKIREKLSQPGIDIDDLRMEFDDVK